MVKFTTEKFIEKAIKKHGPDRYDIKYMKKKNQVIMKINKKLAKKMVSN